MTERFTLEEHQKRMRELLKTPKVSLIGRLREATKRRIPRVPKMRL